jgi:anti-repressor protein
MVDKIIIGRTDQHGGYWFHDRVNVMVIINNGSPVTTSMKVAEYFRKRHKHVLDTIVKLVEDESVRDRLNFRPIFSEDSYGRQQPAFELDRDGFTLLAMGFTGKKALTFKLALQSRRAARGTGTC